MPVPSPGSQLLMISEPQFLLSKLALNLLKFAELFRVAR